MNNQIILIGRLVSDLEIKETQNGMKKCVATISIPRNYKNIDGEYDSDFIPCVLWNGIAEKTVAYCKKGDLIAVKGRLQRFEGNDFTANGMPILEVVADKLTFLSSRKENE